MEKASLLIRYLMPHVQRQTHLPYHQRGTENYFFPHHPASSGGHRRWDTRKASAPQSWWPNNHHMTDWLIYYALLQLWRLSDVDHMVPNLKLNEKLWKLVYGEGQPSPPNTVPHIPGTMASFPTLVTKSFVFSPVSMEVSFDHVVETADKNIVRKSTQAAQKGWTPRDTRQPSVRRVWPNLSPWCLRTWQYIQGL